MLRWFKRRRQLGTLQVRDSTELSKRVMLGKYANGKPVEGTVEIVVCLANVFGTQVSTEFTVVLRDLNGEILMKTEPKSLVAYKGDHMRFTTDVPHRVVLSNV